MAATRRPASRSRFRMPTASSRAPQAGHGGRGLLCRASSSSAVVSSVAEMPQHERPRRGRAASGSSVAGPARRDSGGGGDRRWQADLQDALAATAAAAIRAAGCVARVAAGSSAWFCGGGREAGQPAQLEALVYRSIDPNGATGPFAVYVPMALLLIQLIHLCQPPGSGRDGVPSELRGPRGTLCLPQSGPRDRPGHLAQWRCLQGSSRRLQISQGVREGLLGKKRIQSDRDRRQASRRPRPQRRPPSLARKRSRGAGRPGGSPGPPSGRRTASAA